MPKEMRPVEKRYSVQPYERERSPIARVEESSGPSKRVLGPVEFVRTLKEEFLDKSYDCILVVVGHSCIAASQDLYKPLPEGTSVITGLAAPPGVACFGSERRIMDIINHLFVRTIEQIGAGNHGCVYGDAPIDVLQMFTHGLKTRTGLHPIYPEKMEAFKESGPALSTNHRQYYNRMWKFDKKNGEQKVPYGMVALIYLDETGVKMRQLYEAEITEMITNERGERNGFKIKKAQLLNDLFERTQFRHPFLIDLGCSDFLECERFKNPITLEQFMANGIYGGKKRKSQRKRKTQRKSIRYR